MAKWDLSKLPEGRKPLPDEWFRERVQMQERIAELEAKLRSMALDCLAADGQAAEAYQAQLAAEAKLAKAVEALRFYGGVMPDSFSPSQDGGSKARTTLAELKGEK